MSMCLIDAMCVGKKCLSCENFDYKTSVEITIHNYKTNKIEIKTLRKSELDKLKTIFDINV